MFSFTIKNMMRYKVRNMLTILTIAISAVIVVFIFSWVTAEEDLMIRSFVNYQTGHIKITTEKYFEDKRFMPVYETIPDVSAMAKEIEENEDVKIAMPLYNFFTLLGDKGSTLQIRAIGVDLKNNTFGIDKKIVEGGAYNGGIVMGTALKEKSGFNLKDEILVVSTTTEGGLNGIKLPVNGVYNFNVKLFDSSTIFMDLLDAQNLLRSGDGTTELLITLKDESNIDKVKEWLNEKYPGYKIQDYKEQLGPLYYSLDVMNKVTGFITTFIMLLGSLIIANSIIASIYDRVSEIGMLKAIGFYDKELSTMLLYEGIIYGIVGGFIGCVAGFALVFYLNKTGIDISSLIGSVPMDAIAYPRLKNGAVVLSIFISVFIPILVTFIPMRHIKKITPIEALNS